MAWSTAIRLAPWLCLLLSTALASCPNQCDCKSASRVDCSSRGLTQIPHSGFDTSTQVLDLRHNSLHAIPRDALKQTPFVHTLILGNNRIRELHENVLDQLPGLRRLYVGRNDLRFLPVLSSRPTTPLRVLDVHGNRLTHASPFVFDNLKDLENVVLLHNSLQTLKVDGLVGNKHLKKLHLGHNPWNCDCRLKGLVSFLKANRHLEGEHHAKCANPVNLRDRKLVDLDVDDLKCQKPTAIPTAGGYLLECETLEAYERIDWLFKSTPIEHSTLEGHELVSNGTLAIQKYYNPSDFECAFDTLVSPLRQSRQLTPAQPAYQRPAYPAHTTTTDDRIPRFTYTPRDRSYREGSSVKLNCEVIANPRPLIRWFFNGRPIEPSRKFEMRAENTQLVIYPFLDQDVGQYKCEAANQYGRIESSANLSVIRSSPPFITEAPHSRSARPGDRVVFKCTARGEPRPDITWMFEGSDIPFIRGHFTVSDDGTELIINNVNRQDHGRYTCMAGNSVGAMTTDVELTIQSSQLDLLDRSLDQQTLRNIVDEAKSNINRAIEGTQADLKRGVTSAAELLRHFKFATKKPTELSKAREIYEESLRLVEKHVEHGLRLDATQLPTNLSFESVLAVSHIQTIMELSGCMNGQFKDACSNLCFHSKYRSYDGQCNNFIYPMRGVSQMPFHRLLPPIYENGFNTPVGWDPKKLYYGYPKPNPRTISLELIGTRAITPHHKFSAMLMQWGQFLDHDIDFTATALARQTFATGAICNRTCENVDPCFNIPLPLNDPKRKQQPNLKFPCIEFERSAAVCGSGETSPIFQQVTFREQVNTITSYMDASNVYGSTEVDALDLRDLFSDHGLLRFDIVSSAQKPYMPFEKDSSMDCRRNRSVDNPIRCFLAGDFRANEQLGLTAMHTLWFREHNRIASKFLEMNADWDGERIYQEARKLVGAMMQHITMTHWLPQVLGADGFARWIGDYKGYNPEVIPDISNEFATAAFRFGHTLINPKLERLDNDFNDIAAGPIPLHEAFFAPERMLSEGGIDPLLRGLFASPLKKPLSHQLLNKELTEKLFNRATDVSLDLAVMNIQRGRDHGIAGYTEYRKYCNLSVPTTWEDLQFDLEDQSLIAKLRELYGHPGNMDLWVGGVLEKRLPDALMGPTFSCIIGEQFRRLRDGDRFWYENEGVFTQLQLQQIKRVTLAKVLCNNGDNIDRVQENVFLFPGKNLKMYKQCNEIPEVQLKMWQSCCDQTCSAPPVDDNNLRKRRSHNIYTATETDPKGLKCLSPKGTVHEDGELWSDGPCQKCECRNSRVWCSVDPNCDRL
uniref:Peroxidase n=1 Tax=Panagrellus redivivus TaxID=6233 RepID=A0A7E4WD61_PANRE